MSASHRSPELLFAGMLADPDPSLLETAAVIAVVANVTSHQLLVLLVEMLTVTDLALRVDEQALSHAGALGR